MPASGGFQPVLHRPASGGAIRVLEPDPQDLATMEAILEGEKLPAMHWRNVLNGHNTNRAFRMGGSCNAPLAHCMDVRQEQGGVVCHLNLANSFAFNDGWSVSVTSPACGGNEARSKAIALACRQALAKLLIRSPWQTTLIDKAWKNEGKNSKDYIFECAQRLHLQSIMDFLVAPVEASGGAAAQTSTAQPVQAPPPKPASGGYTAGSPTPQPVQAPPPKPASGGYTEPQAAAQAAQAAAQAAAAAAAAAASMVAAQQPAQPASGGQQPAQATTPPPAAAKRQPPVLPTQLPPGQPPPPPGPPPAAKKKPQPPKPPQPRSGGGAGPLPPSTPMPKRPPPKPMPASGGVPASGGGTKAGPLPPRQPPPPTVLVLEATTLPKAADPATILPPTVPVLPPTVPVLPAPAGPVLPAPGGVLKPPIDLVSASGGNESANVSASGDNEPPPNEPPPAPPPPRASSALAPADVSATMPGVTEMPWAGYHATHLNTDSALLWHRSAQVAQLASGSGDDPFSGGSINQDEVPTRPASPPPAPENFLIGTLPHNEPMATWPFVQHEGGGSLELASGILSMFGAMHTCPPDQCLGSSIPLASGSIAGESTYNLVSLPTESDMVDVAAEVEAEAAGAAAGPEAAEAGASSAAASSSAAPLPFPWPMDRR